MPMNATCFSLTKGLLEMPIDGSNEELKMVNLNCRALGAGLMVAGIFMTAS